ncbi:von Willebrand factor type A domain-containing protein, partial [Candidatus Sumerlaeota bacterium]|nr:von Willebrand factor type A domain-containing protein [Candidatus Sumerlaeota bacterium]
IARNYLNRGIVPPAAAVRVEEILNYFPQSYGAPEEATFAVTSELAPSPFGTGFHLLKIGVKGMEIAEADRKPLVLTFVIDVSGSMKRENRLDLVKRTLFMLIQGLKSTDQIGIAIYGDRGREILAHTPVGAADKIYAAIDQLRSGGSTNAEEGLVIGYAMARRAFDSGATNRVILCSDGVANQGLTHPDAILSQIERSAGDDIYLTALGFGMGNLNDVLLEQLADKGNGHYAYIDSDAEARRFIGEELLDAMQVIAQDVKIQVEFDPAAVESYRLLGFENRDVRDRDFRNDQVDAGEIGAGHAVIALYEIKLSEGREGSLGTVRVRYKQPEENLAVEEIEQEIGGASDVAEFAAAGDQFKLTAIAAEYAEILRNSYFSRSSKMQDVADLYDASFPGNPPSPQAAELRGLIETAGRLIVRRPAPVPPRPLGGIFERDDFLRF